ncbi:MAG: hypothetical protein QOE22_207 [Candidatus Parcubacteria bacterium]|jgi:NTP pyrophosphatase (non-canonical NTP hydrolase)|nr:hypothetical protein [Candidatus Parcubacteria bacterium]
MNLHDLEEEALKLKKEYEKFENRESFRPWGVEEIYESMVSDVGDLGRLVLAKQGFRDMPDLEKNLAHELAEILWATLILAKTYDVDLEKAFMDEVANRKASLGGRD